MAERPSDDFDFAERLEELNEELEVLNAEARELEERIAGERRHASREDRSRDGRRFCIDARLGDVVLFRNGKSIKPEGSAEYPVMVPMVSSGSSR